MIKIGIIREEKTPPDARVPLSPQQCAEVQNRFETVQVVVEPSSVRCFRDEEYQASGATLSTNLDDCDVLLGVKEVPISKLLPSKTYLFFSHTIKKQAHNRKLLQAILEKNIRLIDYEAIVNERGTRLIAFGFYAGVVGAHNGLWTWGRRTGQFDLPRMCESHDYAEVQAAYKKLKLPPLRIVLTGGGRVASGAVRTLLDMGIRHISPDEYLKNEYAEPVFTQLHAHDYVRLKPPAAQQPPSATFDKQHFYAHGEAYESTFAPFAQRTDIFINGIFYDPKAPAFFTVAEMAAPDFRIRVIADITCDIAPDSSVPSTIRPSKIADPVFGFDPRTGLETPPFQPDSIDVMAIDNLPSELPRDASVFFGKQLIENVLPQLLKGRQSDDIRRGMVTEDGHLTSTFEYLADYAAGR